MKKSQKRNKPKGTDIGIEGITGIDDPNLKKTLAWKAARKTYTRHLNALIKIMEEYNLENEQREKKS